MEEKNLYEQISIRRLRNALHERIEAVRPGVSWSSSIRRALLGLSDTPLAQFIRTEAAALLAEQTSEEEEESSPAEAAA